MDAKTNGMTSAHPVDVRWFDQENDRYAQRLEGGLTKRELIAAMVMQGKCSAGRFHHQEVAQESVQMADTLLAELAKGA